MRSWILPTEEGDISVPISDGKRNLVGINDGRKYFDGVLPDHKNWYEDGFVTQPYYQGICGACWAFSTASVVESLAKISGTDSELQEYSVQQLIDCDDVDNFACAGGWMYQGLMYVSSNGILKKSDYRGYD